MWPHVLLLGLLHWLQNCKLGHDSRRARTQRIPPIFSGVHTAADTTQLDSNRQDKFATCSVSKFSSAVVVRRREIVANSIHTADADAKPTTDESRRRRRCVLGLSQKLKWPDVVSGGFRLYHGWWQRAPCFSSWESLTSLNRLMMVPARVLSDLLPAEL